MQHEQPSGVRIEPTAPHRAAFRTDIEGLRAIAVGAVILYHAHVGLFAGGYVGVDVFFVISGYLITTRLVRDAARDRRVSIREFYARRVRRLLPMATVVMLATMVTSLATQNVLELRRTTLPDARAAAWFVSNISFARSGTTYLAEAGKVSVFQQYWSLSAEEQFYLVWPLLMVGIVMLSTRTSTSLRAWCVGALAVLITCSFWLSVQGSRSNPIDAFFLLQYRAWELAIGALVAVGATTIARWIRPYRATLAVIGLVAIGYSIVAYSERTTWPGFAAAVPVVGTALVIAAGLESRSGPAGRFLGLRPMQATGRYSYSLYLWHWPIIILFVQERDYSFPAVVLALVATTLLSMGSFRLIEKPVRSSRWLGARTNVCLALGALLILLVTVVSFALAPLSRLDSGRRVVTASRIPGSQPIPTDFVPVGMRPPLLRGTSADDPNAERNRTCNELGQCSYGDAEAKTTVVLFGDSHAGHWAPALDVLAREKGWRVERLTAGGTECNAMQPAGDCGPWITRTWKQIEELKPDLLILSGNFYRPSRNGPSIKDKAVKAARRAPAGTRVAIFSNTPTSAEDVPFCLADNLTKTRRCEPTASEPWFTALNHELADAAHEVGAEFVDLTPMLCRQDRCPVVAEDVLVYRDASHLTSAFTASRAADLGLLLEPAFARLSK